MISPYWQSKCGRFTVYHADCLSLLSEITADAVVTDPPYGIGFSYASHEDDETGWFRLMDGVVPLMRKSAPFVVMPCCSQKRLGWWYANHAPDWLIAWYKGSPGHHSMIGFNDWECLCCWGRPKVQMHDHFQVHVGGFDDNGHPCPKPVEWASWLVKRAAQRDDMVLDPFMGSGTTGVACAIQGRKFIGIEKEWTYCDIAVGRIKQQLRRGSLGLNFEFSHEPTVSR